MAWGKGEGDVIGGAGAAMELWGAAWWKICVRTGVGWGWVRVGVGMGGGRVQVGWSGGLMVRLGVGFGWVMRRILCLGESQVVGWTLLPLVREREVGMRYGAYSRMLLPCVEGVT